MARLTNQQMQQELDRLAAENAALGEQLDGTREDAERARAEAEQARAQSAQLRADAELARAEAEAERTRAAEELAAATAQAAAEARAEAARGASRAGVVGQASVKKKRGWGWTVLATVLVVIGALLAPAAVISTWAQRELTDTDYFVDTFAPLVKKPAVQDFVTDQTVTAIESQLDIEGITSDVFDGIENLGLPPRASNALDALQAPLVSGIKGLISQSVTKFVQSDAFADIWRQSLTITHKQLLATLQGDENAAVTIGPNGQIGLQLGPIIEAVKKQLVDQGFTFAKNIPTIDKTIVIAKSNSVSLYVGLYNLVVAVGIWLPWVSLLFLVAGVLVARRRGVALVWASAALGISMVLVAIGISVGETVFVLSVRDVVPSDAAAVLYSGILQFVQSIVVAIATLAITVFVIAVLAGPYRWARALRGYVASGFAAVRRSAARHGITTGKVGVWLWQQRVLLRVIVALGASAIVLFVRPLTPPLIVWTAVIAVLVVIVLELLSRPPVEAPGAAEPVAASV